MTAVREQIMVKALALIAAIPGGYTVTRNRIDAFDQASELPYYNLLDGGHLKPRFITGSSNYTMMFDVELVVTGDEAQLGTLLNAAYLALVQALLLPGAWGTPPIAQDVTEGEMSDPEPFKDRGGKPCLLAVLQFSAELHTAEADPEVQAP